MGLLDDAIREHLDLKRRAGGDPGAVSRQEREVFGSDTDEDAAEREAADPQAGGDEETVAETSPPDAPAGGTVADTPDASAVETVADTAGPAAAEPDPAPGAGDDSAQETRQFTADEVKDAVQARPREPQQRPAQPEPASPDEVVHDELEDTPDFLQETPDHDRLWFEQKPPRDFDF